MLEAKKLPVYRALCKQQAQTELTIQQDLADRKLDIDEGLPALVTRHFNHASHMEHPHASSYHVILSARIHILEYATRDINQGKDVDEAVQKVGNVENLFERDNVQEAQRQAQDLADRDSSYLKRSNQAIVQYISKHQ